MLPKGIMDVRLGLLFLFVLGANWVCDARQLEAAPVVLSGASDHLGLSLDRLLPKIQCSLMLMRSINDCSLKMCRYMPFSNKK
ncbi:prosaposin-like isoform X1 [Gossypium australe]|uniref:Prosaposin-like isoform X1 n=1 Tax=Gossypium australe TaxID=47621 RepID=A0A5B6WFV3_9ROSI|nr:prosaposin-like isoform X1 [Gossypium australe]